jgi:hypothetical protein
LLAPRTAGWIGLGVYALFIAWMVFLMLTAGGDMSGLLLLVPALPWPVLGQKLFGTWGFSIGFVGGLIANGVLSFAAGYGIGRWRRRARRPGPL